MNHTPSNIGIDYTSVWQNSVPKVAWGTILLFCGYILGYILVISLALHRVLPYPIATMCCAYLAYVGFTIVHDAGHGSIIEEGSPLKPLESMMGWISGVPLLLIPYSMFKHIHNRHHAYTNDPERDPDHFSFGKKWYQIALNCLFIPFQYHIMAFTTLKHDPCIQKTYITSLIYFSVISGLIYILVINGFTTEIVYFLLIPNVIAVLMLAMLFDYLPHYPHKSLARYHNSRVYPSRWLNIALLGQNYHLTHHMYPKVPWYLYRTVYLQTLPDLESRNSPIEDIGKGIRSGFLRSPYATSLQPDGAQVHRLLTVANIERLTPKSVSVDFVLPDNKPLRFKAGQYLTISKCFDGKQVTRCYSICSSPLDTHLTIGIKAVENGLMSNFINNELKPNQELIIKGPFGDFNYPPMHKKQTSALVLIAVGSGITPILSILKTALFTKESLAITLVYAGKNKDSLMFYRQLELLKKQFTARLTITYIVKDNSQFEHAVKGRIDEATLTSLLTKWQEKNSDINTNQIDFYLCGADDLKGHLLSPVGSSISYERIHVEQFTHPLTAAQGKLHQVDITLANNQKHTLSIASNQTVLEVALANGIDLPYGCNSGHCGSCICKMEKGKAKQIGDSVAGITGAEKEAGYVLSCQCKPIADMKISIDL